MPGPADRQIWHCNKLNQLDNLKPFEFDRAVLLDTDTIAVSDLRPFLGDPSIRGKIVDDPNPPLAALTDIAALSQLGSLPAMSSCDA